MSTGISIRHLPRFAASLYSRLAGIFIAVLTSTLALLAIFLLAEFHRERRLTTQRRYVDLAETLAPDIGKLLAEGNSEKLLRAIHRLQQQIPGTTILILDNQGWVRETPIDLHNMLAGHFSIPIVEDYLKRRENLSEEIFGSSNPGNNEIITGVFSAAYLDMNGEPGYLYVGLNDDRSTEANLMILDYQATLALIAISTTDAVLAFAIALLAFRLFTKRFSTVSEALLQFHTGNQEIRIAELPRDEIGLHAAAFNRMADTVQRQLAALSEADRQSRSLTHSLAAALTRPAAVIAEALSRPEYSSFPSRRSTRQAQYRELNEYCFDLAAQIEQVFALAKFESFDPPAEKELLQVEKVIAEIIAACSSEAIRCRKQLLTQVECTGDSFGGFREVFVGGISALILHCIRDRKLGRISLMVSRQLGMIQFTITADRILSIGAESDAAGQMVTGATTMADSNHLSDSPEPPAIVLARRSLEIQQSCLAIVRTDSIVSYNFELSSDRDLHGARSR